MNVNYKYNLKVVQVEKAKFSELDSKGRLYVDCSECNRGGNGEHKDKCSCGWQVKKGKEGGCFVGALREGLEI